MTCRLMLKLSFDAAGMIIVFEMLLNCCLLLNAKIVPGVYGYGYPPDSRYPAGTGMGRDPYLQTFMGTGMGWVLSRGYEFTNYISTYYPPDCHP